eukprot:m.691331 g.691331  ORF g.691331 m.691331 type:complete len:122 (-) comp22854_c0_seq7:1600-1965(-)
MRVRSRQTWISGESTLPLLRIQTSIVSNVDGSSQGNPNLANSRSGTLKRPNQLGDDQFQVCLVSVTRNFRRHTHTHTIPFKKERYQCAARFKTAALATNFSCIYLRFCLQKVYLLLKIFNT